MLAITDHQATEALGPRGLITINKQSRATPVKQELIAAAVM